MVVFLFVLAFFLWLQIDLVLGKKYLRNRENDKLFPLRYSHVDIFNDGKILFRRLFEDIRQAKSSIHILFYIVRDDALGRELMDLLIEKANEGVSVRLLLDWGGSFRFPRSKIKEMRKHKVAVAFSDVPKPPFLFYRLQRRNHRKITVIDERIGYLGCFNAGREYIGEGTRLKPWRDYHLRFTGEGVFDLAGQFQEDWRKATGEKTILSAAASDLPGGESEHRFYSSSGRHLEEELAAHFQHARAEILIGTPYFIPGRHSFSALAEALKRGVAVKVIVPKVKDHFLVKEGSYRFFRKIIPLGCEIYEYMDGFYHGKVCIIDGQICSIGTANFDRRSFEINYEMNSFFYDGKTVDRIKKVVERDFEQARALDRSMLEKFNIGRIIKEGLAFLLSPLL